MVARVLQVRCMPIVLSSRESVNIDRIDVRAGRDRSEGTCAWSPVATFCVRLRPPSPRQLDARGCWTSYDPGPG